jgi:hypothetical protein
MMKRWSASRLAILVACLLVSVARGADASGIQNVNGHVSIGYAKLFIANAPGGSLSMAGGLDYPIARDLRAGFGVGLHLLGSRTVPRGSLVANVDYGVFEAVLFAHWIPRHLGPVGRISAGPALISARAELSTSGGGAAFSDLAVEHLAPGVALDVTLISHSTAPVRVGFEVGGRIGFLEREDWTMATTRVAFHY